jgi:hypothetical protein
MNRVYLRILFFILMPLCVCSSNPSYAQQTNALDTSDVASDVASQPGWSIRVKVSPSEPSLVDRLSLQFIVEADPGLELGEPELLVAPEDFSIHQDLESTEWSDGKTRGFRAIVTPNKPGKVSLPRLAIPFIKRERSSNEQSGTERGIMASPLIDIEIVGDPKANDLNAIRGADLEGPAEVGHYRWTWLVAFGAIAIALLASIAWLSVSIWRRYHKKEELPERFARRMLEDLLSEKLLEHDRFQDFYIRLTGIVRQFIEKKTGLHAPELTTEEFWIATRQTPYLSGEWSQSLHAFLSSADLVKFGGQRPDPDAIATAVRTARDVIDRFAIGGKEGGGNA